MISIFTYLKVKMAFAEPLIRMNSDHVLGNEVINVDIFSKYIKYINTIVGSKIFLKMTNLYNCLKSAMTDFLCIVGIFEFHDYSGRKSVDGWL